VPAPDRINPVRRATWWVFAHGLARRFLLRAAEKGDIVSGLAIVPGRMSDPFAAYEELRGRGVISFRKPAAATVSHEAVNQILRSDAFGVGEGFAELPMPIRRIIDWSRDPWALGPVDPPSMLAVDPPRHGRYRKLVSRAFTARSIGRLEDDVRATSERLVDEISGESRVDLVETFASQLPLTVIAEILGVPQHERQQLLEWGNVAAITLDPGLRWGEFLRADHAVRNMHRWLDGHIASLRRNPGDDLLSRLAQYAGDDELTDTELRQTALLVLGAGFETTVSLISNAVAQLDAHPDQRDIVLSDPARWGNTVEEVLRFDSPVQMNVRQAYEDVTITGVPLKAGQVVLNFLGGANRDPAVFDEPQVFDVTRANADQHVSFSAGVHYCLGASLARMEARIGLETLYSRFPDLRVAGTPERRPTVVLRGYDRLPVALKG
jgi:cytochrome P450